jgi:uncharacterized protein YyaL (SSP411 family)
VLHEPQPRAQAARELGLSEPAVADLLERGRRALLAERGRRRRPLTDDKVLADWNGLAIGAMAEAGRLLGEARYVASARRAAEFVLARLSAERGGPLLHAYREGRAHVPALLDDYAFLVEGLLRLHEATDERLWLDQAVRLAREQEDRLGDADAGGYFAAGDDARLLFRAKPAFDGAVASGNGVAVLDLLELSELTGDVFWRERAEAGLAAFGEGMTAAPLAHVTLVRGLARRAGVQEAGAVRAAEPRAAAAASADLEQEARDALEVRGRLGAGAGGFRPFSVELTLRRGWHVNANPAGPSLVATTLEPVLGELRDVRYPPGEAVDPGAGGAVYRGTVRLEGEVRHVGEVRHEGAGAPAVELRYQACDETRCLPPITRLVRLQ